MSSWLVRDLICRPAAVFLPLPPECLRITGMRHESLFYMIFFFPPVLGIKLRALNGVGVNHWATLLALQDLMFRMGYCVAFSLTGSTVSSRYNRVYNVCWLDLSSKVTLLDITFPGHTFPEVASYWPVRQYSSMWCTSLSAWMETDGGKSLTPLLLQQALIVGMETEWERRVRDMAFRMF